MSETQCDFVAGCPIFQYFKRVAKQVYMTCTAWVISNGADATSSAWQVSQCPKTCCHMVEP